MSVPLVKSCLLLKYDQTEDKNGVNVTPFPYDGTIQQLLTKGCLTWALANTGTAKIYLWDELVVPPGTTFSFPNYTNLPLQNNVKIKFEGDYELTRSLSDAPLPASTE